MGMTIWPSVRGCGRDGPGTERGTLRPPPPSPTSGYLPVCPCMCGGLLPPCTPSGHLWEAGDGPPLQAHPEDQVSHLWVHSRSMHSLGTYCVPGTRTQQGPQAGSALGNIPWGREDWIKSLGSPLKTRGLVPDFTIRSRTKPNHIKRKKKEPRAILAPFSFSLPASAQYCVGGL